MLYKQCRTEQSAARQRELIAGLQDIMLQQHYDEITVSSLCEQMQIPRKSFYRYFSSKEGALHALIDHALMDAEGVTSEVLIGQDDIVRQEMTRIFSFWRQRKHLLDALANSGLSGVLVQRAIDHTFKEFAGERRFQSVEVQLAQSYTLTFFVSGIMSTVIQWHHDGYPQTPEQMGAMMVRILSSSMVTGFR